MHRAVTRVARETAGRIAALTATAGTASTSRGPAHARAPVQPLDQAPLPSSPCQNEWLITQVDAGDVVFRPEDIDEVANEVLQWVPRQVSHIRTLSEVDSDGQEATSAIEANDLSQSSFVCNPVPPGPYDVLMRVASELMKKPGVQKEVLDVILKEPELVQMLNDKGNMNNCLTMLGMNSAGLLPPPAVIEEVIDETRGESDAAHGSNPVDKLVGRLMTAFERMGASMQHVVNWLKGIFQGPNSQHADKGDAEPAAGPNQFFNAFNNNPFVKAAVVVGVMLVCVLLLRRPHVLAALMRKKAVAAAAAVGVAAVTK